jgi:hypothetical protein
MATTGTMYLAAEIEGEPIPHLTDALFDLDFDRGVSQCQITARGAGQLGL